MKMKKFIPLLALSMLFTMPAFADPPGPGDPGEVAEGNTMDSVLNFTVGDYFKIHRGVEHRTSAAQFTDVNDYSTFTLDNPLIAEYIVYTNIPTAQGEHLTLKGTLNTTASDKDALWFVEGSGSTADALYLLFGNTTNQPTDGAISSCRTAGDTTGQDNPNVIALQLNPTITKQAGSGSTDVSDMTTDYSVAKRVKYTFSNGIYTFHYATGTTPRANTFSTADTAGTYQATLTVTRNGA